MTNYDPFSFFNTPPMSRGTIGFDEIFKKLADLTEAYPKFPTYPPYNVRKTGENTYVIEVAVAGFAKQDIEIELEGGTLTVKGSITGDDPGDYVYKGVADRAFTRKWTLAETVEVKNADLVNGMLKIWLERFIPESAKPKKIEIKEAGEAYVKELDKAIASTKKKETV